MEDKERIYKYIRLSHHKIASTLGRRKKSNLLPNKSLETGGIIHHRPHFQGSAGLTYGM